MSMNWIELFAGGGGVATGLKAAGHHVSVAIEIDPDIAQCYQDNHPETELITADIRDVSLSSLPANITALWASPVCKQDSKARNKSLTPREDASIGLAIIDYIKHIQPQLVMIENVEGYRKNPALTSIVAYLSRHYTISERVLDAANYGVPQHRKRLIIQASRCPIAWPNYAPRITGWYETIQDILEEQTPASLIPWQVARWKAEYGTLAPLMINGHFEYDRGTGKRELSIVPGTQPISTITSSHNNRDKRIILADGRIFKVSPRVLADLQTFPRWYKWPANTRTAYEIIGNAVPPMLVQRLTEHYVAPQMEDEGNVA